MKKLQLSVLAKGFCIGSSMLVPGVSGGSMAMILGLYDPLISSVSSFFKQKKKSALFLLTFMVGAALGLVLLANPLLSLLERFPKIVMFFFLGAVAGSVPMICKKAEVTKLTGWVILYPVLGFCVLWLFSRLPGQLFSPSAPGIERIFLQTAGGVLAAVALVLPGVSVSYMLMLMGIYDDTLQAIAGMQFLALLPLAVGLVIGIALSAKLLERLLHHHPQPTYLLILGFLLGSMAEVFPGVPSAPLEWLLCCLLLTAGFAAVYHLARKEPEECDDVVNGSAACALEAEE